MGMHSYKTIIGISIIFSLIFALAVTCAYAEGGLECINEPDPPHVVGQNSWVDLDSGFVNPLAVAGSAETSALDTSIDTCNGNVRVAFNAGGEYPFGKPLTFYHNSRDSRRYPAGIGRNHTYNMLLLEHPDEWHLDDVRIVLANGYRLSFNQDIDGSFRGEFGMHSRLIRLESGGYLLYTNGGTDMATDGEVCYYFGPADGSGRCRLVYVKNGESVVNFSYVVSGPAAGEIESFKDGTTGRTGRFSYDSQGRLESVTSLDGCRTGFTYDGAGDISAVSSRWGALTFGYDKSHNVTAITDGLGGHSASFSYAGSARGVNFRDTNGHVWDFNYMTNDQDRVTSATFGPRGATPSVFEFNDRRLVITSTIPGKPKMGYNYSADKKYLGSYEF